MKKGKVYRLPGGGSIKQVAAHTVLVDTSRGALVEASFNTKFVSIISRVRHSSLFRGLCDTRKGAHSSRGIFKKHYVEKSKSVPVKCTDRETYLKECKNAVGKQHGAKHLVAACIDDRCRGLPLDVEKHLKSEVKFVKRLPIKSCKWRRTGAPKKQCKGYYCCSSKKSGRGKSKSKCHFVRVKCPKHKGKKVRVSNNIKCTGVFRYIKTRKCTVQTKYTVRGSSGVLTGVAVHCGVNKFLLSSSTGSLKYTLNGRKLKGHKYSSKGFNVHKTHKNSFKVHTKGFKLHAIYNKHTRSFVLHSKVTSKKWSGFKLNRKCRRNAVKHVKNCLFKKHIGFVRLSGKKQKRFGKRARKACHKKKY